MDHNFPKNMNKLRVLLADDHVILLEALRRLLQPVCAVVGIATDGRSLIDLAGRLRPDVIVTDINMPNLNGLDACEMINSTAGSKIIVLTVTEDPDTAAEAIRRGALGYVLKKSAFAELFKAIQTVALGRPYISSAVTTDPINVFIATAQSHRREEPLTTRQREVLQLLAEGKLMKEAADMLKVSTRTIAFHKYRMMELLGITRNAELVRYAHRINGQLLLNGCQTATCR